MSPSEFQNLVIQYYVDHQRSLPWRQPDAAGTFDAYRIMVSEIMLQQTQVNRVIDKYQEFIACFPTSSILATAPLQDVLTVWQGLGYNRRGRFLRDAAVIITNRHHAQVPNTITDLVALPGIGPNTATAILVYAHNQPLAFIETNIRSVYLHHFFPGSDSVSDKEILRLVEQTMDQSNPREWYWALMDYGTYLKKTHGNPNLRSRHYAKQSRFEGSVRQVRGEILRRLTKHPWEEMMLSQAIEDERFAAVIEGLISDKLIFRRKEFLQIAD
jgi:A/G-specific adenine glycosylase